MAKNLEQCLMLLKDNDEKVKKEAEDVLLKLCDNILKNPQDLRYRKIKLSNAIVCNKLLPASGAIECLFEIGFIENDDEFFLPIDKPLESVNELYNHLSIKSSQTINSDVTHQSSISKPLTTIGSKISSSSSSCSSSSLCSSTENQQQISSLQLSKALNTVSSAQEYKKKSFFEKLIGQFKQILRYEDKNLQMKVKSILPLEKLQLNAMEKLRNIQREAKINNVENDVVIEDLLLAELLNWFKLKFFQWVDAPECSKCTGNCFYELSRTSSDAKISRVEIYKCKSCGHKNEFPRYTDPEILLYTRKGRCGEWANCFTLICRTVGFDARLIYDETDHVWTEVWSDAHRRWIHADACENTMDTPLIYEKGWGKKLSYVIAFSKDEIQDVTWRYTRHFKEVMKRRNHCSEEALVQFINKLCSGRQNNITYSSIRKKYVAKRSAIELAEMMNAPPGCKKPCEESENTSEYGGRTSGSLAWRISRGETDRTEHQPFQWDIPVGVSKFELSYSITKDLYLAKDVYNDKVLEIKKNWQNGIEIITGKIFRKQELDWKMVYLARSPGSEVAKITWTFLVKDDKKCVDEFEFQGKTETFHGATVEWEIEGTIYFSDKKVKFNPNSKSSDLKNLKGAIKINLSAILSGGSGDTAWQHAQLFRQSLNSQEISLLVRILLTDKTT